MARSLASEATLRREAYLSEWDTAAERRFISRWTAARRDDSEPLVSIIMPVWNRASMVASAIRSVQLQQLGTWELLVVDDGSTDESAWIVRSIAESDPRVRLLSAEHRGVCAARNIGLREARARYVAFLDSDNEWTPEFLLVATAAMEAGELDAAYSAVRIHQSDGTLRYLGGPVTHAQLLLSNYVDMNSLVVTRAALQEIGGFDESLRRWVDHDLLLRLSAKFELTYLPFIGCDYSTEDDLTRISVTESSHWQFVVLGKHLVDWDEVRSRLKERVSGRVSIVMVAYEDRPRTVRAVRSALRMSEHDDVEVVVVDNGSRAAVARSLAAAFSAHPNVRFIRLPRNYNFATGSNVGFSRSSGKQVMFLNNDTEARSGWLPGLVAELGNPSVRGAQPLLVYPNGTVQTAGTVFPVENGLPSHFLAHHPVEDALRHDGRGFSAITAGAMLVRAEEVAELNGFDPIFANGSEDIDYCLRSVERYGGEFRVVAGSRITHEEGVSPGRMAGEQENRRIFLERWSGRLPGRQLSQWQKIGFEVPHSRPDIRAAVGISRAIPVRPSRFVRDSSIPSLRWAIRIGAEATPNGDLWGDVPFAEDLAASLGRLGQEVSIDRRDAFSRPTSYLDDVVLLIRGFQAAPALAGRCNLMWVISRPDAIVPEELFGYDRIFSASQRWAEYMSSRAGVEIQTLLQATDPARFNPARGVRGSGEKAIFVGGPRPPIGRRIVADMESNGHEFGVWGPGWEKYVDPRHVRGARLDPNNSGREYASAGLVLNDHFEDMAQWGFLSNRLFDAVASGARVISDVVEGASELFRGAVQDYATGAQLRDIVEHPDEHFPAYGELDDIARVIAEEHSFDQRALVLLRAALDHFGVSLRDSEIPALLVENG